MSEMNVMDITGHYSVKWNPDNAVEVELAREQFDDLTEDKGYQAFRVDQRGEPGDKIREFDPSAREIIMMPQLRGG